MITSSTGVQSTNDLYNEGINLSKNYGSRTKEQAAYLYSLIQSAVISAQDTTNPESDSALKFIMYVFTPLIKKTAAKVYPHVSKFEEFDDVMQETYCHFLNLVYSYNPSIATFPYFINKMLSQQVRAWSQKKRKGYCSPVDISVMSNTIVDYMFGDNNAVFDYYHNSMLEQEYEDFILLKAEKKSKSCTVKQVCFNYFLGKKTCTEIAADLGISYHAVYEVIKRIEKELKDFLENESIIGYTPLNEKHEA